MAAAALLQSLASRGVTLARTPEGLLSATPASALQDADRDAIRAHRTALVELLASDELHTCLACGHWSPGHCGAYRAAGLAVAELAAGWELLPQRCRGFRAHKKAHEGAECHLAAENALWARSGAAKAMHEGRVQ